MMRFFGHKFFNWIFSHVTALCEFFVCSDYCWIVTFRSQCTSKPRTNEFNASLDIPQEFKSFHSWLGRNIDLHQQKHQYRNRFRAMRRSNSAHAWFVYERVHVCRSIFEQHVHKIARTADASTQFQTLYSIRTAEDTAEDAHDAHDNFCPDRESDRLAGLSCGSSIVGIGE